MDSDAKVKSRNCAICALRCRLVEGRPGACGLYELIDGRIEERFAGNFLVACPISISVSGAVFQSMFVNPLVSPGLLGVLAGASFGAALGMILAKSWWAVQLCAFGFGLLAVLAAVAMSMPDRGDRLLMLILGGIVSGALFTSLLSVVKYVADPDDQLPAIVYWLMGSLSAADRTTVLTVAGPMVVGIFVLLLLSGYLNVLSMGDEEARAGSQRDAVAHAVRFFRHGGQRPDRCFGRHRRMGGPAGSAHHKFVPGPKGQIRRGAVILISLAVLCVTFFLLVVLYTSACVFLSVLEWGLTIRAKNQGEDERERIAVTMDGIRQRLFVTTAAVVFFVVAPFVVICMHLLGLFS